MIRDADKHQHPNFGGPAAIATFHNCLRPEALRRRFSPGLPLSVYMRIDCTIKGVVESN